MSSSRSVILLKFTRVSVREPQIMNHDAIRDVIWTWVDMWKCGVGAVREVTSRRVLIKRSTSSLHFVAVWRSDWFRLAPCPRARRWLSDTQPFLARENAVVSSLCDSCSDGIDHECRATHPNWIFLYGQRQHGLELPKPLRWISFYVRTTPAWNEIF